MQRCKVSWCDRKATRSGYCRKHKDHFRLYGKIKRTKFDPNEFLCREEICKIKFYDINGNERKRVAVIDLEDYDKVVGKKWRINKDNIISSGRESLPLTHVIMGKPGKGFHIDHKNLDRLDNQKNNLRRCSHQENQCNKKKMKGSFTSKYKGVSWNKQALKWRADIGAGGKFRFLGHFSNEEDAALAYNQAAIKYHGEFANLNSVER